MSLFLSYLIALCIAKPRHALDFSTNSGQRLRVPPSSWISAASPSEPPPHRASPPPRPAPSPPTGIDGFKSETLARISLYTRKGRAGTIDLTIRSATASVHGNQCKYPLGVLCSACPSTDKRHICIYIASLRPPRGRRYACPRPICNCSSSSLAFPPSLPINSSPPSSDRTPPLHHVRLSDSGRPAACGRGWRWLGRARRSHSHPPGRP